MPFKEAGTFNHLKGFMARMKNRLRRSWRSVMSVRKQRSPSPVSRWGATVDRRWLALPALARGSEMVFAINDPAPDGLPPGREIEAGAYSVKGLRGDFALEDKASIVLKTALT